MFASVALYEAELEHERPEPDQPAAPAGNAAPIGVRTERRSPGERGPVERGSPAERGPRGLPSASAREPGAMSVASGPERPPGRPGGAMPGRLAVVSAVLVLLFGGLGVAGWVFLPTATVTVTARAEPLGPLQFTVRADPLEVADDVANGIMPADVVTFDLRVSQEFPTSGKKITETKATGTVRWTNCDPTRSYSIPSGTVVRTAGGQQFATGATAFPPVAILSGNPPNITCQSRDVSVTARKAATDGNVGPGTITVVPSAYNSVVILVTNRTATTGGSRTETRIVAQKDIDAALATLTKALRDQFTAQLSDPAMVPSGLTLFPATKSMSAGDPTVPPDSLLGTDGSTFTLGLEATGTATAVDTARVQAVGDARIRTAVAAGRSLVKDSVDVRVGAPRVDGSAVLFPVTARASQVRPPDVSVIRRIVKGLSVDEAGERLRDYGDATIDVWPGWVITITSFDTRLEVRVVSTIATEPASSQPSTLPPGAGSSPSQGPRPGGSPSATPGAT